MIFITIDNFIDEVNYMLDIKTKYKEETKTNYQLIELLILN